MRLFDNKLVTLLCTDASDNAVGAVLSQVGPDGERPVAFESRKLTDTEKRYTTLERELLAIVHATKAWRHWVQGREVLVFTDNQGA